MTKHFWYLKIFLALTGIVFLFILICTARAEGIDYSKIAWLESRGNPMAYNKVSRARGLFQITPICLFDYNKENRTHYTLENLFDPTINRRIAEWYFEKRIPQFLKTYGKEDTIENRLICFHAGIKRLIENKIPKSTREYIKEYF